MPSPFYKYMMRLFELRGKNHYGAEINKFKEISSDLDKNVTQRRAQLYQFRKYLEKQGYEPHGHGSFSVVFTHPSLDYCIKIFRNDPAYMAFVRFCMNHSDNPHFPRFRGKMMQIDADNYAVRMENLDDFFSKPQKFIIKEILCRLPFLNDKQKTGLCDPEQLKRYKLSKDPIQSQAVDILLKQNTLIPTMIELIKHKGEFALDIHVGNFLLRDETIVCVDPYVDSSQIDNS